MKKKNRKGKDFPGRCPYCGSSVTLRSADGIYRDNSKNAKLYVCSKYPVCDAYARIQPGSKNTPLSSMANGELRALRREAHRHFNQIYKSGLMSKQEAYAWLSGVLNIPMTEAHIGRFGEYYCKTVIEESKRFLANNKKRREGNPCAPK